MPAPLAAALGDRYRLERPLGQGGMATVHLAEDLRHHRQVAIKVLKPEIAAALGPERFQREIEIVARLQHPHILPIHDSGEAAGYLYFVMPYVAGESLAGRMARERQFPVADAMRLLRELTDALAYAHRRGIVHRDIKPDNILLSEDHVLISDFGVAKALTDAAGAGSGLTSTGMAVGTPAYMAPEQAMADPEIDHRADLYAVGLIAYEMLVGEAPFRGTTPQQVLATRLRQDADPVTRFRPNVPPGLAAWVARALERTPADRWRDAGEMRAALDALITGSGTSTPTGGSAPPPLPAPGGTAPAAGRPLARIASAALAVVVLAGAGVLWNRHRASSTLDADLVAVAPFDVLAQGEELWREGLVDVLSRNLDGAGALRSVAPTVVVRRWRGRADPTAAKALGQATGAGLVVFGNVVAAGGDTVRASAGILDVARDRVVAEVEVREEVGRMDRAADSLTVRLLRELGRDRAVGTGRLTSLGTRSLPALKLFLRAEQFYRRAQWDSAESYAGRALELDSSFTLARRRQATAAWWKPSAEAAFTAAMLREGAGNQGLAPRESLLVAIDSAYAAVRGGAALGPMTERLTRLSLDATARYPSDPETWYHRGEIMLHVGWAEQWSGSTEQTLAAFTRSIALDSAFAPAYQHAIELSLRLGDTTQALALMRGLSGLNPSPHLLAAIDRLPVLVRARDTTEMARAFEGVDVPTLTVLRSATAYLPGPLPTIGARAAQRIAGDGPAGASAGQRRAQLAYGALLRGHTREALALVDGAHWVSDAAFLQLAMVGAVPPDSFQHTFDRWSRRPSVFLPIPFRVWAASGDSAGLRRAIQRFQAMAEAAAPGSQARAMALHEALTAQAYLPLTRGDAATTIRQLRALPDTLYPGFERFGLAELLWAAGDVAGTDSLVALELNPPNYVGLHNVLWELLRGRVHERLGRRERAVASYERVLDYWHDADAMLQPYAEEARAALDRLRSDR